MSAVTLRLDDVLVLVDIQNDFCPSGALAVPAGDEVVPLANRLSSRLPTILTQDWHPAGHKSFASVHSDKKPFDSIELSYGPQVLWPDHCVQGTPGAEFHPALVRTGAELIIRKGFNPAIDSYSAFRENDRTTPTGLAGYLRERGFRRIFLAGLAFDFCVAFSAEDAVRCGFEAVVIEDACRAIDLNGSRDAAKGSLAASGVSFVTSEMLAGA